MPVPSAAGKPWEGMDWRDEGTPEFRESLTDEQADEWRNWQYDSQQEALGGGPAGSGGASDESEGEEYQPPNDPSYQPGSAPPDAPTWDHDSLPAPSPQAESAAAEPELPDGPPDPTGKPWEGMDPLEMPPWEWRSQLSDAEADEWYEWRSWHEQKAQQEEDAQSDREDAENEARIRQEIEHEQETGEIDAYRLAHGAPAPPAKTVAFVDDQGNSLDALVKDQPIRIEVTVPRADGQEPPQTIEAVVSGPRLTFIGREYTGTDRVTLEWIGNVDGPAIYRSGTMTIENGGEGVSSLDIGGFEFNTGGGMGGFSINDGDFVQVGIEGANSGVQVFTSVAKLEIALTLTAINTAHQSYTNVLINLDSLIEQVKAAPESPEKADLLQQLTFTRDKAQQVVTLANKAVWRFNNVDNLDHEHLAALRLYAKWMGLFREPTVGADGKQAPGFGPLFVPDPRVESEYVQDETNAAKEEVRRIFWAGLTQATIGGYRLLAQATMVAQIMTIFGTNEMGQKASGMERWMAFFDLLSQAALMGAMMKWNTSMATGSGLPGGVVPRTTGRIPRQKPLTDTETAKSAPSGTPVAPEAAGMLRHGARDGQLIARKNDAAIQVRFTSPDAMPLRAEGFAPKSPLVKSKTIKEIDRQVGAPDTARNGAAGFFEPKLPERGTMTDAQWAKVQKQFNLRQREYDGPIGQYQRKLADEGKLQLRDGMVCDKDGTPFAGDYDLFEITNRDGTPVSPEKYDQIVDELMAAPGFQAAHGAHMRWNPKPTDEGYHLDMSGELQTALDAVAKWQADRSIFRDIVAQHQPGGEGLITFAPNQPPVITYAGEAVGPKFADLGITPLPTAPVAGPITFVRPTLYVATTDQLLAGRYPDGDEWDWTRGPDWTTEVATFTERANAFDPSRFSTDAPVDEAQEARERAQVNIPLMGRKVEDLAILAPPTEPEKPGFNSRPIVIGGALVGTFVVVVGGGILFLSNQNGVVPPVAVATQTPGPTVVVTATPSGGGVVLPPTQPPPTGTAPPTADSLQTAVNGLISEAGGGLIDAPSVWELNTTYRLDAVGDLYLPNDGSPANAVQNQVDFTAAFGFVTDLTAGDAVGFSSHACGTSFTSAGNLVFNVACNIAGPMEAGSHLVVVMTLAQAIPDPFPDLAQCVFSVQADTDDDKTTGFQSGLPFNYLIGADVYFENLVFVSNEGEYQNYILATDYSLPPRADTGDIHGNLPTHARVFWTHTIEELVASQTFIIPVDEIGDTWAAGGFCTTDRGRMGPDTLAVDAFGQPGEDDFPIYLPLISAP